MGISKFNLFYLFLKPIKDDRKGKFGKKGKQVDLFCIGGWCWGWGWGVAPPPLEFKKDKKKINETKNSRKREEKD